MQAAAAASAFARLMKGLPMRTLTLCLLMACAVALSALPARAQATKKVVFVAGPKDHGRPGRHEYGKDLAALKQCLETASNLKGVTAQLYTGQLPPVAELKDAAVVVVESSGDRIAKETHAIFPADATTDHKTYDAATSERLSQFDGLMKQGVGLVVLHYATWVDNDAGRKYFLDWAGGYHEANYSKVLVNPWSVSLAAPSHPVLRGVQPWSYEEEFYIQQRLPEDPRRTALLTASSEAASGGHVVSWAVERAGGGRGFVFTGMDFYRGLGNDNHRRTLANGIAWAAKLDIPSAGVQCGAPGDLPK
jgi:type 1 glutamine amidotransferase